MSKTWMIIFKYLQIHGLCNAKISLRVDLPLNQTNGPPSDINSKKLHIDTHLEMVQLPHIRWMPIHTHTHTHTHTHSNLWSAWKNLKYGFSDLVTWYQSCTVHLRYSLAQVKDGPLFIDNSKNPMKWCIFCMNELGCD